MDFHFTAKRKPTKRHKKTNKKRTLQKSFRRKKVSKEKKFCLPTRVAVAIFPPLHDVDVHDWLPRFGSFQLLAENKALASYSKNPAYETRRRRRMFLIVSFSEKFSGFLNLKRLFSSMSTVYNLSSRFLRKRKCFCTDCKGKLRSLNTVKRHRSLSSIRGKCDSLSLFECYLTWNKQLKHVLKQFR